MIGTRVNLNRTVAAVADAWTSAENSLIEQVELKNFDLDEDTLTTLFSRELIRQIDQDNKLKVFERAFVADLTGHLGHGADVKVVRQFAAGVIAAISTHPRKVERRTGGDFGISIGRPQINYEMRQERLTVGENEDRRGVVCQAKVRRRSGKWGSFTSNQKTILPAKLDHLALCLYDYADGGRKKLMPFSWQVCRGFPFEDVESWLSTDSMPVPITSGELIGRLGRGIIGVSDQTLIRREVNPDESDAEAAALLPNMELKITWRNGRPPDPIYATVRAACHVESLQRVRAER
jgi:hypothetical protein